MDGQMSLHGRALDAFHVQALYEFGSGWTARVGARANGQTWGETEVRLYEYLTTDELLDVLAAELGRLFGGTDA
jgi:hypothetical protein